MTIKSYKSYRLKSHPYAQCIVKEINNYKLILQSYSTDVIIFNKRTGILTCTGLYSMTTRTHITWFLKEYFPSLEFKTIKTIAINNLKYNVYTGEII